MLSSSDRACSQPSAFRRRGAVPWRAGSPRCSCLHHVVAVLLPPAFLFCMHSIARRPPRARGVPCRITRTEACASPTRRSERPAHVPPRAFPPHCQAPGPHTMLTHTHQRGTGMRVVAATMSTLGAERRHTRGLAFPCSASQAARPASWRSHTRLSGGHRPLLAIRALQTHAATHTCAQCPHANSQARGSLGAHAQSAMMPGHTSQVTQMVPEPRASRLTAEAPQAARRLRHPTTFAPAARLRSWAVPRRAAALTKPSCSGQRPWLSCILTCPVAAANLCIGKGPCGVCCECGQLAAAAAAAAAAQQQAPRPDHTRPTLSSDPCDA